MNLTPLNLESCLNNPVPKVDFVLPGLPVRSVGAIVAPGSTGKSFLALQIAAALALRLPVAGGALPAPVVSGKTVLFASEESATMLVLRMHSLVSWLLSGNGYLPLEEQLERGHLVTLLANSLEVYPLAGQMLRIVEDGGTTEALDALAKVCQGARLLIVDPLRRFHNGDENSSGDMTTVVQAFESVAHRTGCAVLITHHTNKAATLAGNGDMQQAIRGSSALTDAIRWQANLVGMTEGEAERFGVEPEKRRYFVRLELAKANYVEPSAGVWMRRQPGGCLQRVELHERRGTRGSSRGGRDA